MTAAPATTPTVSVVIPVHDGGAAFEACLRSVIHAQPPPDEIIVVDDGSTDDSGPRAAALGARVIRRPQPGGPAHARNEGAAAATGDLLFFVDADVAIRSDAVAVVRSVLAGEPGVAAAFGSYDDAPAHPGFLSQYKNLLHHYVHQTSREDAATFWAGCGAIRREVFRAVGGFDADRYPRPSIEDIELGYRLRRAGHPIRRCPALQGKHHKQWTVRSLWRADFFGRALPWTALILENRGFIDDLNVSRTNRLCVALTCALLAAVILTARWPESWVVAGTIALSLLILNSPLYLFLLRKRGPVFVLGAIGWHWFSFLYSALAFAIGSVRHHLRR